MLSRKKFIYFLLDTPTGKAYYRNKDGTFSTSIITASGDVSLPNAPFNWLDTELSFARNTTYHALNRSFTTPMEFVRDAVQMIKELFLLGYGTETPLTIAIFQYNDQPKTGEPDYLLYYKGNLDLSSISENVLETLTTNVMEGGVTQLLKTYENTTVQIPCDGSIIENQKVNLDGLLVSDTFHYKVTPINQPFLSILSGYNNGYGSIPATFITNEGDNFGITHLDPSLDVKVFAGLPDDSIITSYCSTSQNYIFMADSKITVEVKGSFIVRYKVPCYIDIKLVTSKGQVVQATESIGQDNGFQMALNFDSTIDLAQNEALFVMFHVYKISVSIPNDVIDILDGDISLAFESKAKPTRVWAITGLDLFKLIVKEIGLLSSTQFQSFNYEAVSNLLGENLNLMFTSGDALRASGDNTYQKFYSLTETNQILQTSFGPVIKITLKDFFQCIELELVAALGNGHDGTQETLFIEPIEDQYPDEVTMEIGEISKLSWKYSQDLGFSDLEMGYAPQTYDQKAGKYEYNTTLTMKAPINSFQKKFSKISKIRFDSYGIERLRANIAAPTSTTRNDSDNSLFGLNVNPAVSSPDYFDANFQSQITEASNPNNTNQHYLPNISSQPLSLPITDGDYFQSNLDNAILVFSEPGFDYTGSSNLILDGLINSVNKPPDAPIDNFTLKIWHNGNVIYTYVVAVSGINTPISINHDFTQVIEYKDCLYVTMETSDTAEVLITSAQLTIGTIIATASVIPILGGVQKLLSYSNVSPTSQPYTVGTSKVQYGFQYFVFNSLVPNTIFTLSSGFTGYLTGTANFEIEMYVNGVKQFNSLIVAGPLTGFSAPFPSFTQEFKLNDIIFFTASNYGTGLDAYIQTGNMQWTSNYVKCFSLKRVQYDSLTGIPNIAKDINGNIRSDIAGAPYNIEDVTPKTCYLKWRNYIMSCNMDKVMGDMKYLSLSKNPFLSRTYQGVTITEAKNEPILGFKRLFYPIEITVGANVPRTFAQNQSSSVNAHIHGTFMGNDIYFFADAMKQKTALNESQTWTGLLSPKTDIVAFSKINAFKIPDMQNNSLACSPSLGVQFVPYTNTTPDKYHTQNRNTTLFKDQLERWDNKEDYGQPVQIGDLIPLQFISRGLSGVAYTVHKLSDDSIYAGPVNLDVVTSPAVTDPYSLYQKTIDTTSWESDVYYIVITAAGGNIFRSEPLLVLDSWQLTDTVLIEYSHSSNTQWMVFDTGFVGSMRVKGGYGNRFTQKYLGKSFIDQEQDISILNAMPYETASFFLTNVPDYVAKKVMRQLLMDQTTLDGEGFTLDDGAQYEEVFTKGAPMKIQRITIRPTKNGAISATATGVDNDSSMIVSVNPQSFGPNITNSSGTTETDLIQITVNG